MVEIKLNKNNIEIVGSMLKSIFDDFIINYNKNNLDIFNNIYYNIIKNYKIKSIDITYFKKINDGFDISVEFEDIWYHVFNNYQGKEIKYCDNYGFDLTHYNNRYINGIKVEDKRYFYCKGGIRIK